MARLVIKGTGDKWGHGSYSVHIEMVDLDGTTISFEVHSVKWTPDLNKADEYWTELGISNGMSTETVIQR